MAIGRVRMCRFLFNDTATAQIYTLSLHDGLPISANGHARLGPGGDDRQRAAGPSTPADDDLRRDQGGAAELGVEPGRSEEHTSELQSRQYLVCRLLLEKKTTS